MDTIKIKFVDFWFGFSEIDNYFFKLLSQAFQVVLSDTPDILIYSSYGREYLKYNCIRLFYTAENIRPDFTGCDYAISFDYSKDRRHFRLPLYALYIEQNGGVGKLLAGNSREEALAIWNSKTKFCCMVVSNGQSKKRLQFFEKLSRYKKVDSGGAVMNNIAGPVKNKMNFIKAYRFVISFENTSYPGYTTEKIIEPFLANSIPLYWGDPLISKDFNTESFFNLENEKSEDEFIKKIIAADINEDVAINMLMQPKFANGIIPSDIDKEQCIKFFKQIVVDSVSKIPVSNTTKKHLHLYKIKKHYYINRIKGLLNKLSII